MPTTCPTCAWDGYVSPSRQAHVIIEKEITLRVTWADQHEHIGVVGNSLVVQLTETYIAEDVNVMDKHRTVSIKQC